MKQNCKFFTAVLLVLAICCALNKSSAQTNQTVTAGSTTATVSFPAGSCTYQWTNNNPSIGLATSGTGDIASFTAVNNSTSPIVAHITATPVGVQYAYITNYGDNTVSVINTVTNTVIKTIPVASQPNGVAVSHDGKKVYITGGNNVSVIDVATNKVVKGIAGPSAINSLTISPDGSKLYVADETNSCFWIIDTAADTIIAKVPVQNSCTDVAVTPDGKTIYATGFGTTVSVVDAATLQVKASIPSNNLALYILTSPDGKFAYLSNSLTNQIDIISTLTNTVVNHFQAGNKPGAIALTADGSILYASNNGGLDISVINTVTGATIKTFACATSPDGISLTADERYLYVAGYTSNRVEVFDTQGTSNPLTSILVGKWPSAEGDFITPAAQTCTGAPVSFTITVNPPNGPISANGNLTALSTVYGTYSSSGQFTVSDKGISAGVLITPPQGFAVSTDGTNFYPAVSAGVGGSALNQVIFIRLSATASVGTHSGNIVISSPNVPDFDLTMPAGTVTPVQLTVTADNQIRNYGSPNPKLTFTYSGFVNSEDESVLTTMPTATTIATKTFPTGKYPITLSGGVANNYTFNYLDGTLTITATPGTPISIPNAFTPNNDGINDTWNIANLNGYPQSHVQIFNRYGALLYNSTGYAIPWDGTLNRARIPDGVYYYIITLQPGGNPVAGSVTVIR